MSSQAFIETEPSLQPILAELIAREPIFHRPEFASTIKDFARMMAPGYWEVGGSGRRYSRDFILETLAHTPPVDATASGWQIFDPQCRRLGEATYLLTYTLHQGERRTRRATIWQSTPDSWQILYHQGTVIAAAEDPSV